MNDTRRQADSIKEYVTSIKEIGMIFTWLWKEATTPESRKYVYRMLFWLSIAIVLQAFAPAAISYVFKGLTAKNGDMVVSALVVFAFISLAIKSLERMQERAREWCISINFRCLEDKVTTLFLGKSLAQHIYESKRLAASSIDKGKWKMFDMQVTMLFNGIPLVLQIVASITALIIIDRVSGFIMSTILLVYICWSLFLNYRVAKVCTPIEKDFKALSRKRHERSEQIERVKTCGHEAQETQEMSLELEGIMRRDRDFWLWFIGNAALRSAFNVLSLSAVMAWGAWLVWTGKWNIGLLYPLYAWANRVSENMWKFGDLELQLNKNVPTIKSVLEGLAIPPAIVDKPDAVTLDHTVAHEIVFENVSHTYAADVKVTAEMPPTLLRINLRIKPGEKVAIMGGSGAGKTTLMKKLLRFDNPTSGRITIGGIDSRDISQSSYMRGIGYAAQQAQAFDGTIRDNLLYGLTAAERKLVTDEQLLEIMRLLKIDFKSLDTVVGSRGLKLSGGQSQRLLLGAAVVKNPWLLVIDEGTASLDSTTEKAVQQGLAAALSRQTSALIVTHRLNTVRDLCDTFVVLKSASEVGESETQVEAIAHSFEELYKISPTFRQLADDQGVVVEKAA
jgi:ATP-binding cassette, subfamily B, heavy metal transporter